ncbi:Ig-like protein group 2 [Mobilisporobacter senegalensis]|uniref:Ig-like protein group 2 n=1 Tax=Mobilisporobacter senegalensis TaxID=1329262 RepID=A0A3N1XGC5_9FIRM|nr:Ig-like domain-containing protein [Mobilisporobacter senegalensis]ROR25764.1 Ig-like protein group 2 [Mobilisporobacter senegalensis]
MNKFLKRIAVFLCFMLIAPTLLNCIPSVHSLSQVEAAAKAKLYASKGTIGISSTPEYLYVENKKDNAKYTYTSKNKKVATVDKYGKLTGVSKGKTDIVVKETYKGKTTTVGTYKLNVALSKLFTKKMDVTAFNSATVPIDYYNYKAKYSFTPKDKSILTVDKKGYLVGLKEGSTTVTVTETYKKAKRSLGSVTVNVKMPAISKNSKSIDIGVNSTNYPLSVIDVDYLAWGLKVSYESADSNIVSVADVTSEWGDVETVIKGVAVGTTELTLFGEYNGQKFEIGKVNVTVKEIPVTQFKFDPSYVDEELGYFTKTYYLGEDEYSYSLKDYLIINPENTTTPVTFSSSNESVAKVDNNGKVTTISKGTAMITATCGSFSDKMEITVENYDEW